MNRLRRADGSVAARLDKMFTEYDGVRIDHPHGLVCPCHEGRFDLILMDVRMPRLDGLSATAQLYCNVENLFSLPPGAFSPPPKVHSSVLRLTIER